MSSNNNDDAMPQVSAAASSHQGDHLNLRVTYLHAGNPRPPHNVGAILATTTVGALKSRLQTDLLEHPRPEEQRLIYQGRPLMQNDATLREALRLEGPIGPLPYTIHIIIQPRQASSHFRPAQPPPMAHIPQANNLLPLNPSAPPLQQMEPLSPLEQAQILAHAHMNRWHQQLVARTAMLAQNPAQAQPNSSATFQVHGQPFNMPPNLAPNSGPAQPNMQNIHPLAADQQRILAEGVRRTIHQTHPPIPNAQSPTTTAPPTGAHLTESLPARVSAELAAELSPFQRPSSAPGHPRLRQTSNPTMNQTARPSPDQRPNPVGLPPGPMHTHLPHPFSHTIHTAHNTVWLASSQDGPQALLFAPGHGFFSSQMPAPQSAPAPTQAAQTERSTTETQPPAPNPVQGEVAIRPPAAQAHPRQRPQNQNQNQQDDNELWALVIQRGWLFLRLYMFMFVLSEPGTWRRYLLLVLAVIVCLLPRQNPLNQAFRAARRHIDNLIGPPQPQGRDRARGLRNGRQGGRDQPGQGQAQAQAQAPGQEGQRGDNSQPANQRAAPARRVQGAVNTTPEETARRLVREHEQRHPNILRDVFYRMEQAVALFLASLIPGVGERHVAAREEARREDERRTREAEAQRAREREQEEERKRREEQGEVAEGSQRKSAPEPTPTSTSSTSAEAGSSSVVEARGQRQGEGEETRPTFT